VDLTTSLEAVVILGATRYLLHAWEQLSLAWNMIGKGQKKAATKKAVNVLLATALPCWGTVAWGYSAIPGGGTLGALFTGLALAAGIAGLHNVGKTTREGKALENAGAAARVAQLVLQLRSAGADSIADAVAEGRTPSADDLREASPAPTSGRYPGPYNPAYRGPAPPAPEDQVPPLMGED